MNLYNQMHPNLLFTFLSLCNFISSISLAIVAPFFPPFAKDRGIDEDLIGLIFSAHPLGAALAALLVGKKLRNKNRKAIMVGGLIAQGLSLMTFATLILFDAYSLTIIVSVLARFLNGVGSAMFLTPFYALIPIMFPSSVEGKIAICAFVNSSGFMVGPVFGSFLYDLGSFQGPFLVFGSISFATAFGLILLKLDIGISKVQDEQAKIEGEKDLVQLRAIKYYKLLLRYEIFMMVEVTFICNVLFTFYGPIISNYFNNAFGIDSSTVGYYMVGVAAGYAFSAFIIQMFPIKKHIRILYFITGLLVAGISQFFYGPDQWIGLDQIVWFNVAAQFTTGFSILFTYVLLLPLLNKYVKRGTQLKESVSTVSSTLFNMSASAGEVVGPLLGGYLVKLLTFERASSIMGLLLIASVIVGVPLFQSEMQQVRNSEAESILLSEISK